MHLGKKKGCELGRARAAGLIHLAMGQLTQLLHLGWGAPDNHLRDLLRQTHTLPA